MDVGEWGKDDLAEDRNANTSLSNRRGISASTTSHGDASAGCGDSHPPVRPSRVVPINARPTSANAARRRPVPQRNFKVDIRIKYTGRELQPRFEGVRE